MGKTTDDPYPALQPEDTEDVITAEFDLDEIASARFRCAVAASCHLVDILCGVTWCLSLCKDPVMTP